MGQTEKLQKELEEIYESLHRHPELGFTEYRTAKIVETYLKNCGLEVITGVGLTGVVGILDSGKPGKSVMLRADMDGLPIQELANCAYCSEEKGKMHACGHDAHVTMLLGAAKELSGRKDSFSGKIKFVFQPAEEGSSKEAQKKLAEAGYDTSGCISGAKVICDSGILDDVDACVIMHVQPSIPTGKVYISKTKAMASSDSFSFTILGKGGHGAQPQNAIDPVPALGEIISAFHMLPTREISAVETCVFSIGNIETPGSTWNAVAEKAVIEGGLRTFNEDVRNYLRKRIVEIVDGISKANRCSWELDMVHGYSPCVNNEEMSALVANIMEEFLGKANVIYTDIPYMTSEDCGVYLKKIPGVFFWLGIGYGEDAPALHSAYFQMDLKALRLGVQVHVENAINILKKLNREEA